LHSAEAAGLGLILIYHFIVITAVTKNEHIYKNNVTNKELTTAVHSLGHVPEKAKRFSLKSKGFFVVLETKNAPEF